MWVKTRALPINGMLLCVVLSACGGGSDPAATEPSDNGDSSSAPLDLPPPPGGASENNNANDDPVATPVPAGPLPDAPGEISSGALAKLGGTWRTGCIPAPEAAPAPGRFILSTRFDDTTRESTRARYLDDACTQLFVEFVTVEVWSDSGLVLIPSGFQAYQLDSTVASIAVTYHDEQVITTLNSSGYCGVELEVGVSIDLTECLIDLGFSERNKFDLAMVASGILYPADAGTGEGSSPESRPSDVDFTQGHAFVQP